MDKAESIVASKRVAQWSEKDREWLLALSQQEREVVLLLAAHLDASPVPTKEETK